MHKKSWEVPFPRQLIVRKQDSPYFHLLADSHFIENHNFLKNTSPVTRPLCDLGMSKDDTIG